jgi:hypothetical protein
MVTAGAVLHADAIALDDVATVEIGDIDVSAYGVDTQQIQAYERELRDALASRIGDSGAAQIEAVELEGSYPATRLAVTFPERNRRDGRSLRTAHRHLADSVRPGGHGVPHRRPPRGGRRDRQTYACS